MFNKYLTYIFVLAMFMFSAQSNAQETEIELEEIQISDNRNANEIQTKNTDGFTVSSKPRSIGALFTGANGFGVVKRGGYAMEPVLRGFKYDQLSVQFDGGTHVASACANRMDPITTRINSEEIEKIEILKGPYSVRFGQNLGGIVNIITERPKYEAAFAVHGIIDGSYETNGEGKITRLMLNGGNKKWDFYVTGGYRDFGNYKSGDGKEIASMFNTSDYAVKLGFNPGTDSRLLATWRQSYTGKVLHAGLPMDAKDDWSYSGTLDYSARNINPVLYSVRAKMYYSYVDHWMTNEWRPSFASAESLTGTTSEAYGGKLEFQLLHSPSNVLYAGADWMHTAKDGARSRLVKINTCTGVTLPKPMMFTDKVWQNSFLDDAGIFLENKWNATELLTAVFGIRMDYVQTSVLDAENDYAAYWGKKILTENELNISANAGLTFKPTDRTEIKWQLGRGARSADLLERYINHLTVGMDAYEYIGNPALKAEINYQTDITFTYKNEQLTWYINGFYSYINNYISAVVDSTILRKFTPCMNPKYTKVFTNIDRIYQSGFEVGGHYVMAKHWNFDFGASYTYAQNASLNEPLAEIPPFGMHLSFGYKTDKLHLATKTRYSAKQQRVSTSFAESETPAYEVIDLVAEYRLFTWLNMRTEVDNLLNKTYYDHLSRAYKSMPEESEFYEPGRNFRFTLQFMF